MNLSRPLFLLITLVAWTCLASSSALAQKKGTYRIIGLSADPGEVYAMNAAGVCVGQTQDATGRDNPHAWTIDADNQVVEADLATNDLGGWANDINQDGIIVGTLAEQAFQGTERGVVWLDRTAEPMLLTLPAGDGRIFDASTALAVSDRPNEYLQTVIVGRIVELVGNEYVFTAAAWAVRNDGTIDPPLPLDIAYGAIAQDVNSSLTVVGNDDYGAIRWQLAWLPGVSGGGELTLVAGQRLFAAGLYNGSYAVAINADGDICGSRSTPNGGTADRAFLLDRVVTKDSQGNVTGETLVDRPLMDLVENRRESTQSFWAYGLDNSSTPRVSGSAGVYWKSSGIYTRFDFPVLWQGTTVVDVKKATPSLTLSPSGYLPAINDRGWLGGRGSMGIPCVLIPN